MPVIYLGETPEAAALAEALSDSGFEISVEPVPKAPGAADLAVVAAAAGTTSYLRHAANNPLTAVLGFADLLLRRDDLPSDVPAKLALIRDQAMRVRGLLAAGEDVDVEA